MPKKRKTLPKNFGELIKANDLTVLQAVFDTCELAAYDGYNKDTALHMFHVPTELICWLVEQGLDVNVREYYGRTPLYAQAALGSDVVETLLELGADIHAKDDYGRTPLYIAAGNHRKDTVALLIAHGADIHVTDDRGETPLSFALARCQNVDIADMAEIADILLRAGAKITPPIQEHIQRIGKEFEFRRADFNKDLLPETDAGLARLYTLFGVKPVAKRQTHDGVSPILVPTGEWHEQHDALWQLLVPGKGAAQTVQGEAIRLSGKLAYEIMDNGGCNWDGDFRKMLQALVNCFAMGQPLTANLQQESAQIATSLKSGTGDDHEPERLMELAVQWVALNPHPLPLKVPAYKR